VETETGKVWGDGSGEARLIVIHPRERFLMIYRPERRDADSFSCAAAHGLIFFHFLAINYSLYF
jgi:hypothetical protein